MSVVRGESVFYEQARGRWVGVLDLGTNGAGKRIRRRRTAADEDTVRRRLRRLRDEIEAGAVTQNANLTVRAFLDQWLEREVPKFTNDHGDPLSANALDIYEWSVRGHLIPALGHIRLVNLTADHIDELLEAKADAGMAKSSMVRLRSHLRRALNYGVRRGRVHRNVADLVEVPTGPKSDRRSLTVDEGRRLFRAAKGTQWESLVVVAVTLSLRPGELLGLCWQDVDLSAGVIHVRRQMKWEKRPGSKTKQPVLGDLKQSGTRGRGTHSRRSLQMAPFVVDLLAQHKKQHDAKRVVAGEDWCSYWGPIGLVFSTRHGRPISPSNLRRAFRQLCDQAAIGHWVPYEARHSGASLLTDSGVHGEHVADYLGHDGTRMLEEVYRHTVRPVIVAGADTMQRLFAGNEGSHSD